MKRKLISMTVLATMLVSLVGGCGKVSPVKSDSGANENNEASAKEKDSSSANEKIVLRFSWWGGDERNEATLKVIDQFEALHENVTIEAEYGGNDGYHDKLATQLASGTAPDIIQVDPEIFPKYIAIDDYFHNFLDYKVDVSGFDESYISLEINGRYNGKQLGLPSGISGAGLLVNKELADAVGIDFNQDYGWEDLIDMGKKVREYDDSMYLLCMNKEYIANLIIFNYAKQLAGTTLCDATDIKLNITEAQLEEVYTFVQRLYDEEVIPPASYQTAYSGDNLQSDPNWISGKYVATYTYISTMDVMAAANASAQYYAGKLPSISGAQETGWASNTPQVIAMTKGSKHPEMAAEFMNYFFNHPTAQETLGTTRSVPAVTKAREICTEKGLLTDYTMEGANIAASMGGTPNDKISSTAEAKAILFDATESIGYGMSDPAKAAADTFKLLSGLVK